MYQKLVLVLFISLPILFGCSNKKVMTKNDYEWTIYPDGNEEKNEEEKFTFVWKNNIEITILSPEWMSYYHDLDDYLNIQYYYSEGREATTPVTPTLRWDFSMDCNDFTILLSLDKEMENFKTFISESKSVSFPNLFAGTTYYYQIKANLDNEVVVSRRCSFKTVDFFRTAKIDGVYNVRDLGNKKTIYGKKVKQGLVYRSASLDGVTALGIEQAKELGIKTDLDLREQGPTESPLGEGVKYINNGFGRYGSPLYVSTSNGIGVTAYKGPMKENLRVFANKDNYPLVFHCAVGRDRTGTLAITLLLLLGVDVEQIKQDYVASFFSKACNSESLIDYSYLMGYLLEYFEYYNAKDINDIKSIYLRAEEYCLDIGLTKEEIESIRDNLLE